MAYRLLDVAGNDITHHDLQDKGPWCQHGASKEEVFVLTYGKKLDIIVNPAKKTDPYAPDLLNNLSNKLGDLKVQNTPFFQAKERFSLDPQFTVVFNKKDRDRYNRLHPNLDIYFWVDWIVISFISGAQNISVNPMCGIWHIPFASLNALCDSAPLHEYGQRRHDTRGNARSSYVISLTNTAFRHLIQI